MILSFLLHCLYHTALFSPTATGLCFSAHLLVCQAKKGKGWPKICDSCKGFCRLQTVKLPHSLLVRTGFCGYGSGRVMLGGDLLGKPFGNCGMSESSFSKEPCKERRMAISQTASQFPIIPLDEMCVPQPSHTGCKVNSTVSISQKRRQAADATHLY